MLDIDDGAIGWIKNYARQNYWRVSSWYDFEDLVHDGYVKWYQICERHPELNKKQIMGKVKRAFAFHIHDLSNKRTKQNEHLVEDLIPPQKRDRAQAERVEAWDNFVQHDDMIEELVMMYQVAPDTVKAVLDLFATDEGLRKLRMPYRHRMSGGRETLNQRLCRLTGYDYMTTDLVREVRAYLKAA